MNWVAKIQEAILFIETNLFSEITLESVGKAVNYSPSAIQNVFSAVTGYSIGEYIRFRRLSCSVDDLADGQFSVTEVASKYGYETSEAFSKAFKRLFDSPPTKYVKSDANHHRFNAIKIDFKLTGGFSMTRNLIPGLQKVDWSDTQRQSEFVNSVISVLRGLGRNADYDYTCAVSGSAFRSSFSEKGWNFGNYHASYTPILFEHTFKMFGYSATHHIRSDFETDSKLITDSIDKGFPVITLGGVINCSDTCLISGYDNDGHVLLGYNPFMYIEDDHNEKPDDTGYFRKSNWHGGYFEEHGGGGIIIIGDKYEPPTKEAAFDETLHLIKRLIAEESIFPGQHNGLAAHKAFANALLTYEWEDNFEPYMCVMCTYKQYLDRQYAAKFFEDNNRPDLAGIYNDITSLTVKLGQMIPQDFSAGDMFNDKNALKSYCDVLLQIGGLEAKAADLIV